MRVKVKSYAYRGPGVSAPLEMELPEGTTLSQLLRIFLAEDERAAATINRAVLLLNQRQAELNAPLKDGDELCIYPVLGGGA